MKTLVKKIIARGLLMMRDVLDPLFHFQEVSIMCYHSVSDAPVDTAMRREDFLKHLELFRREGVSVVPLSDIVAWVRKGKKLPHKAVALTFDDGYADFETTVVPILEKYQAPATVFVVGNESAARAYLGNDTSLLSGEAIERLRAHPLVEVSYHSTTHANLTQLAHHTLAAEVMSTFPVRFFAYPGGNHSPEAADALRKAGYEAAFTIGRDLVSSGEDPYLIPRTVILRHTTLGQVRLATTKAGHWFRTFGRIMRNKGHIRQE